MDSTVILRSEDNEVDRVLEYHNMANTSSDEESPSVESDDTRIEEIASQIVAATDHGLVVSPNSEINVVHSPNTHFGPKIYTAPVTIINAPVDDETVRGRALVVRWCGSRRARIILATGWCLLVIVVALLVITKLTAAEPDTLRSIGLNVSWYKRRDDWQALDPTERKFLKLPVEIVFIGHSVINYCDDEAACLRAVLLTQKYNMATRRMSDISYNFIVGGDGTVLEGRGANVIGGLSTKFKTKSLCIAFMGNYNDEYPTRAQIDHVKQLIKQLVKENIISDDFKLFELSIIRRVRFTFKNISRLERNGLLLITLLIVAILCTALYYVLSNFVFKEQHSDSVITDRGWLITREGWMANAARNRTSNEKHRPLKLVVIGHSVSTACSNFIGCAAEMRFLQDYAMSNRKWDDIAYNFAVGGDGCVYEGRGWQYQAAHTLHYNQISIGIGFIGDYTSALYPDVEITPAQIANTQKLLQVGVEEGYLSPDYVIKAHCDLRPSESPGDILYNEIIKWSHYSYENSTYKMYKCKWRQEQ